MNTLIISEKPSVASKIAIALGNAKRLQEKNGVGYYQIVNEEGDIFVVSAVGHIFTIAQSEKNSDYPVLNIEWAPSYKVNKSSEFTKKYLDVIEGIATRCEHFINACDFDVEGTVIGTNIIRFFGKIDNKSAKRMKFSTTTSTDLLKAYNNLIPLDMNNFYAGETRHMLDWLWGINLSRALTRALNGQTRTRGGTTLSIGRVQGPALGIIAKREYEIDKFITKEFWRVFIDIKNIEFINKKGDIFDKELAQKTFDYTIKQSSNGIIKEVSKEEKPVNPYPPFDLTSLQLEASRVYKYDPSRTLAIAQSLYERSYISYPRTSSQKLPESIGLKGILEQLSKNSNYTKYVQTILAKKTLTPSEGKKSDDAHPAIYPTGFIPEGITEEERKLYDIIARRFISCFMESAKVDRLKVSAAFGDEIYSANGAHIKSKGWLEAYPFVQITEKELPEFKPNESVNGTNAQLNELTTQPPKRYTKAGLIAELERQDLGTKATRAAIIDTLFRRGYISNALGSSSMSATKFGLSVYEALKDNCSMIVDETTTRKLEEDMENISKGKKSEDEVLTEGKKLLLIALDTFDKNKDKVSEAMRVAMYSSSNIGKCPKDGGELVIRKSKMGKSFVGCSNYPACTNTYSLPQNAKIEPTGDVCEHCKTPIIKVIRKGKRPFSMDLDPNCITKKEWAGGNVQSAANIKPPSDDSKGFAAAKIKAKTKKTTGRRAKKAVPKIKKSE